MKNSYASTPSAGHKITVAKLFWETTFWSVDRNFLTNTSFSSIHQVGCTRAPGCHIKCSICSHSLMSSPFTNISPLLFVFKLYPFYYRHQGFFIIPFIAFFPTHCNFQCFVTFSYALPSELGSLNAAFLTFLFAFLWPLFLVFLRV